MTMTEFPTLNDYSGAQLNSSVFFLCITVTLLFSLPSENSPVSKVRMVEGSEFLNEDSSKAELVSGLNGKPSQWSFEELIDVNVHAKARPLMEAEDCNQVLIHCDGSPDGTGVAFEDKGTAVNPLHSSAQPIEALSGEERATLVQPP